PQPIDKPQSKPRSVASRPIALAMAAAVSVATIGTWLSWSALTTDPSPIAQIAYSTGGYAVTPPGDGTSDLLSGSTIRTSNEGRMLLVLDAHTTVRLDQSTRATLRSGDEIYLHSGRLYLDSHGGSSQVQVTTKRAAVTKVGTQFEVSVTGEELEIAVREGQIKVQMDDTQTLAKASNGLGEVLHYDARGQQSKDIVATTDPKRWHWTQLSRPDFDIASATYYEYLNWAARERGLTLRFADEMLEQSAKNQTGGGRYDASDDDIDEALYADGFFARAAGEAHELLVARP
ncbi:MAG: FecR domain-containing protein, partial [Pseudomonadales bacterium]